ncbi:MAG: threonine synthase, partial [Oscillospiraceae bacterium]|nr:threonine synthase [Oscillospiraceae bacterium]
IGEHFAAGCCDDANTQRVIAQVYDKYGYLIDPHTAVAFDVLAQYRAATGDDTPALVVSTASPFKFCDNVLGALGQQQIAEGLDVLDQLTDVTGLAAPAPLAGLKDKSVRFDRFVEKEKMVDMVLEMLD